MMHELAGVVGLDLFGLIPEFTALRTGKCSFASRFGLRGFALPADQVIALGRYPCSAMGTRQHNVALRSVNVFLPRAAFLGTHRAFQIDAFPAAVGTSAG